MKKTTFFMVLAAAMGLASCGPQAPKANLKTDLDSLSYMQGMEFSYARLRVDSAYQAKFIEGFVEGTAGVSSKKKAQILGTQIGSQMNNEAFDNINRSLFGNDSLNKLNKDRFIAGFIEGLNENSTKAPEEASEYIRTIVEKYQKDSVKVSLGLQLDTLSYMIGASNTQGLKNYVTSYMGVEANQFNHFVSGVKEGTKNSDENKTYQLSGILAGEQISNEVFKGINDHLFANDSTKSLSKENFLAGIIDGIQGKGLVSIEEATSYVRSHSEEIQRNALENKYAEYKKENEDFLETNKTKEGIQTTESGLQYRIIKAGKGTVPTKDSKVKVHYKGTLIDGTKFDSSYDRNEPTTFGVSQVIAGWTEALTLMPVGSKWELYIPQEIAYGARDMGTIKPFSTLIFEVELLGIEK